MYDVCEGLKICTAFMLISILALHINMVYECEKLLKPKYFCAILIPWNIISKGFKVYLLCGVETSRFHFPSSSIFMIALLSLDS